MSDEEKELHEKAQRQILDKLVREFNHDDELITWKVVTKLREQKVETETICRFVEELLTADLPELDRLTALLGALNGVCEIQRHYTQEKALKERSDFYEFVKENGVVMPEGVMMPSEGGDA